MKLKYIIYLLLLTIATGCKKVNETDISDFEVKSSAQTFNAGEKIVFTIEGKPFQIAFYTGEIGKDYQYKDTPKAGSTTVDIPLPIKGYSDAAPKEYTYIYTAAGNYRATFVASSITSYSDETVVKYIDLIIK